MKKNLIYTIIGITLLGILVVGSTFAFFQLSKTLDQDVNSNTAKFDITYTKGEDIDNPLYSGTDKESGLKTIVKIKLSEGSINANVNLFLLISTIDPQLASSAFKWEVIGKKNGEEIYTNSGNFEDANNTTNNRIELVENYRLSYDETQFEVFFWLDDNMITQDEIDKNFSAKIKAESSKITGKLS